MKRNRRFYIEPGDHHTSEVLAKSLPSSGTELPAKDGKYKRVYEVSEKERDLYTKSRTQAHLDFRLWTALDGDKLAPLPIDFEKRRKIRKVRRQIKRRASSPNRSA